MSIKDYMTLAQACEFTGLSKNALLQAIKVRKSLRAQKLGKYWVLKIKDVENYNDKQKGKAGRPRIEDYCKNPARAILRKKVKV